MVNLELIKMWNDYPEKEYIVSKWQWKWWAPKGEDIVWSLWQHKAAVKSAYSLANYMEHICGRICRLEKDKQAEMFNLVIKGTQDVKWFANGATTDYIIIDEAQLENVLEGRPVKPLRKELLTDYKYRY